MIIATLYETIIMWVHQCNPGLKMPLFLICTRFFVSCEKLGNSGGKLSFHSYFLSFLAENFSRRLSNFLIPLIQERIHYDAN